MEPGGRVAKRPSDTKPLNGGESPAVGEVSPPFPRGQKDSACFAVLFGVLSRLALEFTHWQLT